MAISYCLSSFVISSSSSSSFYYSASSLSSSSSSVKSIYLKKLKNDSTYFCIVFFLFLFFFLMVLMVIFFPSFQLISSPNPLLISSPSSSNSLVRVMLVNHSFSEKVNITLRLFSDSLMAWTLVKCLIRGSSIYLTSSPTTSLEMRALNQYSENYSFL